MYAWARVPLYINERLMIFGKTCLNCHWLKRIRNVSEEEFLSSVSFRSLIAEGEVPEVRLVFRNVKHVLSHRVIYANFYEVVLPENSRSFSEYQCIRMEDLEQYPVSRLVHAFLEKYL